MHIVCAQCGSTNRVPEERLGQGPKCGHCHQTLLPATPSALDDASLPGFLAGTQLPVVADFWATWCAPCRAMAPAFERAAAERPRVQFIKIDTDACPQASSTYGIRSIPTLMVFQAGREQARLSGALPAGELLRWIDQALAAAEAQSRR